MKVHSIFNNKNSQLPLSISILELDNSSELESYSVISARTHFEILKRYHFDFSVASIGEIVPVRDYIATANYSNYELDKIELEDFTHVPVESYASTVAEKLTAWAKTYGTISQEELAWLIKTTNVQINKIAEQYSDCYLFDLPTQAIHNKRHPHFTLYEFFLSFIFYGNRNNRNMVGYVLLAYA